MELGSIRAGWQIDPRFGLMSRFVIVLSDPLPDFSRSRSDDRVLGRVVVWIPTENLNS
jgi:hypothetical protein